MSADQRGSYLNHLNSGRLSWNRISVIWNLWLRNFSRSLNVSLWILVDRWLRWPEYAYRSMVINDRIGSVKGRVFLWSSDCPASGRLMIRLKRWGVVLVIILVCTAFNIKAGLGVEPQTATDNQPAPRADYLPIITGVDDPVVRELLKSVSNLFLLRDNPPASLNLLQSRADRDVPRLREALRSKGYFKGNIQVQINDQVQPLEVTLVVDLGPPFLISTVNLEIISEPEPLQPPSPEDVGLKIGERYDAEGVLEAQKKLISFVSERGYPFPEIEERKIIADHAVNQIRIHYRLRSGPKAVFGTTRIEGLRTVDQSLVAGLLAWRAGEPFDVTRLKKTSRSLIRTGLFSVVEIKPMAVDAAGRLSMQVLLKERKHRTVKAGIGYQTDLGPEVKAGWEHRNFFGKGEKLALTASASEPKSRFEAKLIKPNFLKPDQILILGGTVVDERTDAFKSRGVDVSAGIERQFTDILSAGLGIRYRLTEIDRQTTFGLISFPLFARLEMSDDLLDPSRGGRLFIGLTPSRDTLGQDVRFYRAESSYSHYFQLIQPKRLIVALKGRFGYLEGAIRREVPEDELFYAGGGGSVRGYAFQTAGRLLGDDPVGGLSIVEVSMESRVKLTSRFGLVAFLDGGRAYDDPMPDWSQDLFWGWGLGLRYYTPIGPIRLDVAFPLDRRPGVDEDFQVYISIGQAF